MHLASRPPYRRMTAIDRALKSDQFPSASRLAKELEVDRRTIFRDVEFMRCTFGAPIKVCRKRRGYYYAEPGFQLSAFQLTEGELVSLFVAERVMKQYRGTSFERDLSRAFQKITSQLDDEVSLNVAEFEESHSFRLSAPSTQDVETFGRLAAAVRSRKRLRITYWTASRDDVTQRKIDPLHLANIDGDWFLIAWCHLRNQVRSFVPSRIRELKVTEETFAPPVDFSVAKYLSKGFRVIQEQPGVVHLVRLKFFPFAARYVAERTWHPSQKATRRDDGSLEIALEVASLIEVRKWALSFGSDCEVLEPAEFRQQIADHARAMWERHQPSAKPMSQSSSDSTEPADASPVSHQSQPLTAPPHPQTSFQSQQSVKKSNRNSTGQTTTQASARKRPTPKTTARKTKPQY